MAQTMKNLWLVNRHWSSWAPGATKMLRIPKLYVSLRDIVEALADKFFNVEGVQLDRVSFLTDNGLHALHK